MHHTKTPSSTVLRPWLRALVCAALLAMVGCATTIPEGVRNAPTNNPSVSVARDAAAQLVGSPVRWGGTIARVENKETETWIEVVQKELRRNGEPAQTDTSGGRFIARIGGFLDPVIYEKGRQITIAGALEQPIVSRIGDFTYLFPVVKADSHYLWEAKPDVIFYEPVPYWYYDPWYPYGYPYYYPPRYWR